MAGTKKPSFQVKYLIYKRGSLKSFFGPRRRHTLRPFTIDTCKHNNNYYQFSSAFPTVPIFFLAIGSFRINLPDKFK